MYDSNKSSKITHFFNMPKAKRKLKPKPLRKQETPSVLSKASKKSRRAASRKSKKAKEAKAPVDLVDSTLIISKKPLSTLNKSKLEHIPDKTLETGSSVMLNKLYSENLRLNKELEISKQTLIKKENKFEDFLANFSDKIDERNRLESKSKVNMCRILIQLENMKRQNLIREIAQEKARLGFFGMSQGFSTTVNDWIEGAEVRKWLDLRVEAYFFRILLSIL